MQRRGKGLMSKSSGNDMSKMRPVARDGELILYADADRELGFLLDTYTGRPSPVQDLQVFFKWGNFEAYSEGKDSKALGHWVTIDDRPVFIEGPGQGTGAGTSITLPPPPPPPTGIDNSEALDRVCRAGWLREEEASKVKQWLSSVPASDLEGLTSISIAWSDRAVEEYGGTVTDEGFIAFPRTGHTRIGGFYVNERQCIVMAPAGFERSNLLHEVGHHVMNRNRAALSVASVIMYELEQVHGNLKLQRDEEGLRRYYLGLFDAGLRRYSLTSPTEFMADAYMAWHLADSEMRESLSDLWQMYGASTYLYAPLEDFMEGRIPAVKEEGHWVTIDDRPVFIKGPRQGAGIVRAVAGEADILEIADRMGFKVAYTAEDSARAIVDLIEKEWGFDEHLTRSDVWERRLSELRGQDVSEEFVRQAMDQIAKQVSAGRAGPLTVIFQDTPERTGFVGSTYEEPGIVRIYDGPARYFLKPKRLGDEPLDSTVSAFVDIAGPFGAMYIHEFGHYASIRKDRSVFERARAVLEASQEDKALLDTIKWGISRYAAVNAAELAAECYAISVHPDFERLAPPAKDLVRHIMEGK